MQETESDLVRLMRVVRRRREAKHWTVNHLADLAGISGVYLNGMEKGKGSRPGVQVVARLARALGTTTDALLIESGLMDAPDGWQAGRQPLDVYLRETANLRDDDISAVTHLVRRLAETPARYEVDPPDNEPTDEEEQALADAPSGTDPPGPDNPILPYEETGEEPQTDNLAANQDLEEARRQRQFAEGWVDEEQT